MARASSSDGKTVSKASTLHAVTYVTISYLADMAFSQSYPCMLTALWRSRSANASGSRAAALGAHRNRSSAAGTMRPGPRPRVRSHTFQPPTPMFQPSSRDQTQVCFARGTARISRCPGLGTQVHSTRGRTTSPQPCVAHYAIGPIENMQRVLSTAWGGDGGVRGGMHDGDVTDMDRSGLR